MCWIQIGMAAVGVAGKLMGNKKEDKAIGEEIGKLNAQKQETVRQLNYEIAGLDQEQRDQFDQAVSQLQANSINSIRNQGMIRAALGETNLEGRSMDAVMREVEGQDARVADSIRDNYARSWTGIQANKISGVLQTQSSLDGMPTIKGPSAFARTMGVMQAGVQGWMGGGSGVSGIASTLMGAASSSQGGASTGFDKFGAGVSSIFNAFKGSGGGGTGANTGVNAAQGLRMR